MRFLLLLLFFGARAGAQTYVDTSFTIRGTVCSCKYNLDPKEDKDVYTADGISIRNAVEKSAQYSNDDDDWSRFVKKNLDKGFKGKHDIELRFKVAKNGELSSFELLSKTPSQKFDEIIRVLKLSGKWFPATINGYCVDSFVKRKFEL